MCIRDSLNTEAVLYSKNANTQLYPASITKLLTCLLGCENLDVNAQLTLSQQAAYGIEAGSSTIYGDAGEVFTVEQCLMALKMCIRDSIQRDNLRSAIAAMVLDISPFT